MLTNYTIHTKCFHIDPYGVVKSVKFVCKKFICIFHFNTFHHMFLIRHCQLFAYVEYLFHVLYPCRKKIDAVYTQMTYSSNILKWNSNEIFCIITCCTSIKQRWVISPKSAEIIAYDFNPICSELPSFSSGFTSETRYFWETKT